MHVRLSKRVIGLAAAAVILAAASVVLSLRAAHTSTPPASTAAADSSAPPPPTANTAPSAQPSPAPAAPPPAPAQQPASSPNYSIDDPASIWVVVNKKRPLPSSYAPADLVNLGSKQMRTEAATALKKLFSGAANAGISLKYVSGYRSYGYQTTLYNNYVAADGQAKADTYSARPGHSEHQSGLAMDVGNTDGNCELDVCFGQTAAGQWVAAHAHEYGFVVRYTADKTAVTGYQYEPWHLRYVGTWLAQKIHDTPQTLEEYFGLGAAPSY